MYYGDEKNKEMMRSILPSKRRKGARDDKRLLNKKLRNKAKQALHLIKDEDDWDDSNFDFWDDGQHERTYIVQNRRDADKISHFMRWAEVKAKDIPDGEKMGYIRSILPGKGAIFDHACFHLEWLDGFNKDIHRYRWRSYWNSRETINRDDLILLVRKIVEIKKFHIALNDAIRRYHEKTIQTKVIRKEVYTFYERELVDGQYVNVGEPKTGIHYHTKEIDATIAPRILEGMFDVEDFVDDLIEAANCDYWIKKNGYRASKTVRINWYRTRVDSLEHVTKNPEHHPEWLHVLKFFVDDFINDPKSLREFDILTPKKVKINKWNRITRKSELVEVIRMKERYNSFNWNL